MFGYKNTIPKKLKAGDMIRVIAPSNSMAIDSNELISAAQKRVESLGLRVSFGRHVMERDAFESSSIESRLEDLHEAFADKDVNGIWCVEGGFNSNQLIEHIDWNLIRRNPKFFQGYSDTTVLNNAFLAKAGLVTYSGPLFITMALKNYYEYNVEYFKKCAMESGQYEVVPSDHWQDDDLDAEKETIKLIKNDGPVVIPTAAGDSFKVEGTIVGGNLSSIALLQGTPFMPDLKGAILFIEDDYEWRGWHFDRCLQGLVQISEFKGVKAVVWGRFQPESKIDMGMIRQMVRTKKQLDRLPNVCNFDFGHSNPKFTFPVGGRCRVEAREDKVALTILKH